MTAPRIPITRRNLLGWTVDECGLIDLRHPRLPDNFFLTEAELSELVAAAPEIKRQIRERQATLRLAQQVRERARQAAFDAARQAKP